MTFLKLESCLNEALRNSLLLVPWGISATSENVERVWWGDLVLVSSTGVWGYMSHVQEEPSWSDCHWRFLFFLLQHCTSVYYQENVSKCCTPKGLILFASREYCNTSVWILVFLCFVLRFKMNLWTRKHELCKLEQITKISEDKPVQLWLSVGSSSHFGL